jgi:hypothetical protein
MFTQNTIFVVSCFRRSINEVFALRWHAA